MMMSAIYLMYELIRFIFIFRLASITKCTILFKLLHCRYLDPCHIVTTNFAYSVTVDLGETV